MAAITQTSGVLGLASNGAVNLTPTTMTASDTLAFQNGAGQVLELYNTTGSGVTVVAVGTAPVSVPVPGTGMSVDTSAGKSIVVPANGWTRVELDDISAYLKGSGVVTITNGTGLKAALYV